MVTSVILMSSIPVRMLRLSDSGCSQPTNEEDLCLSAKMSAPPNVTLHLVSEPDNICSHSRDLLHHNAVSTSQEFNLGIRGGKQKNIFPGKKKAIQIEHV